MNIIMQIQTLVCLALMIGMGVAGAIFPNVVLAEVPLLDTMLPEHLETATFSMG
jgi:hypothetical protein